MKIRRAIGFAVLAYVVSMIAGMIMSVAGGIDMTTMTNPPMWMCIAGVVVSVLVCWKAAWLYFRSPKVAKSTTEGLKFGILLLVIGFILDVVIRGAAYPGEGSFTDTMGKLMDYYKMGYFWVTFVLILIVSTLTGQYMAKKRAH